jgi:hypothetical protein
MRKLASLALLLCLTTPFLAPAQDPMPAPEEDGEAKIVLVAPDSARVGELVRFDVSASVADSFEWLLVPPSQDFEVYDAGRRAVFSARVAGEYRFIIACAKNGTVNVITHVVKVLGPPAQPATDSLAEWIPFWLWTYDLPRAEKTALAASFEEVAARIDELKTAEDWIKATAESNRKALGPSIDNWGPMLDKIGAALLKMAQDGRLMTPEQHQKVWLEIADGLRKG